MPIPPRKNSSWTVPAAFKQATEKRGRRGADAGDKCVTRTITIREIDEALFRGLHLKGELAGGVRIASNIVRYALGRCELPLDEYRAQANMRGTHQHRPEDDACSRTTITILPADDGELRALYGRNELSAGLRVAASVVRHMLENGLLDTYEPAEDEAPR